MEKSIRSREFVCGWIHLHKRKHTGPYAYCVEFSCIFPLFQHNRIGTYTHARTHTHSLESHNMHMYGGSCSLPFARSHTIFAPSIPIAVLLWFSQHILFACYLFVHWTGCTNVTIAKKKTIHQKPTQTNQRKNQRNSETYVVFLFLKINRPKMF